MFALGDDFGDKHDYTLKPLVLAVKGILSLYAAYNVPTFSKKSEVNDPRVKIGRYELLGPIFGWKFRLIASQHSASKRQLI